MLSLILPSQRRQRRVCWHGGCSPASPSRTDPRQAGPFAPRSGAGLVRSTSSRASLVLAERRCPVSPPATQQAAPHNSGKARAACPHCSGAARLRQAASYHACHRPYGIPLLLQATLPIVNIRETFGISPNGHGGHDAVVAPYNRTSRHMVDDAVHRSVQAGLTGG